MKGYRRALVEWYWQGITETLGSKPQWHYHHLCTGTSLSTTNPTRTCLGVTDPDNVNHTNVLTVSNWSSNEVDADFQHMSRIDVSEFFTPSVQNISQVWRRRRPYCYEVTNIMDRVRHQAGPCSEQHVFSIRSPYSPSPCVNHQSNSDTIQASGHVWKSVLLLRKTFMRIKTAVFWDMTAWSSVTEHVILTSWAERI